MILSLRIIDLVAGATLVGVVGGGAVALTTDLHTAAYAAPVSSTVVADPAPRTELVSADPYVRPGTTTESSAADRTRTASRVAARPATGFVPHSGLAATSAGTPLTAATTSSAGTGPSLSGASVVSSTTVAKKPRKKPRKPKSSRTVTTDVTISSFNVLGASHTKGKGKKRGFAKGKVRAGYAAEAILGHDVDLVGFQELERPQARTIVSRLPGYSIFPGPSKRLHASANSIAWRNDTWQTVETHTVGIPYFSGNIIQMPYVRLRNVVTGTDVWVGNFHNPASVSRKGDQSHWRAEATKIQVELANRLRSETGLPVVFTGDFNEREVYFCRLVGGTELEASNGGTVTADGTCTPPRQARIDWIFGTPELDWQSHLMDKSELIRRTTDHPMVVAEAKLRATVGR